MPRWLTAALAAATVFGLNTVCVKQASGKIADALGAVLIQGTCLAVVAAYFFVTRSRGGAAAWTWAGIAAAIGSGLCLATGLLLLFASFRLGGALSIVNTILLSIQLVIATLIGLAVFHDSLTWSQLLGMGLCLAGFWLVSRGGA